LTYQLGLAMQYTQTNTRTDSIFERTHAGQCEMLTHEVKLTDFERSLLAVVTGFTSLGDIMTLLGVTDIPHASVATLLAEGLISPTESARTVLDASAHQLAWRAAHLATNPEA
jgi:hypothetical protein